MSRSSRMIPALLCAAILAATGAAGAAELGRLFFTPEKRATMERQRTLNVQEAQTLQGTSMSLDGVVYRSSGKATVWVNRQAQNESEASRTGVSATISPKTPGSALLAPGEEAPAQLKVGESINRATGERNNRLGGGTVLAPAAPTGRRQE